MYEIILSKRQYVKEQFSLLIQNGPVSRDTFHIFLREIWLSDIDLFDYLNDREIAMLRSQWP